MKAKEQMTLREWIELVGIVDVSKSLRVTEACVRHWRRGYVMPDTRQMQRIRKFTKGKVSIDLSVDEHFSAKNKKRYKA